MISYPARDEECRGRSRERERVGGGRERGDERKRPWDKKMRDTFEKAKLGMNSFDRQKKE